MCFSQKHALRSRQEGGALENINNNTTQVNHYLTTQRQLHFHGIYFQFRFWVFDTDALSGMWSLWVLNHTAVTAAASSKPCTSGLHGISLPPKKTKNQESISTVDLNWLNLLITGSGGKHLYTFNPSTQDAVPGRSASLRPAWSIAWIPVQPGLHRERLSRKIKTKPNPQKRKNKTSESALVCVDTYSGCREG